MKVKILEIKKFPATKHANQAISDWQKREGIRDEQIISVGFSNDGEMGMGDWFFLAIAYKE